MGICDVYWSPKVYDIIIEFMMRFKCNWKRMEVAETMKIKERDSSIQLFFPQKTIVYYWVTKSLRD